MLNLDLMNYETPPTKPSIEEPPILELKVISSNIRNVFLIDNDTFLVIVVAYFLK